AVRRHLEFALAARLFQDAKVGSGTAGPAPNVHGGKIYGGRALMMTVTLPVKGDASDNAARSLRVDIWRGLRQMTAEKPCQRRH
ncbi:hypothetical protein, partial [Caballeronia fortuita]|uniref:hypothetical protein n=1 Tax=Caballeronia fortuita TaxID=1777138 RepID=UPI001ABF42FC